FIFSHPSWLLRRLQQAWPRQWEQICRQNNTRPPMTLRVNCLRSTRDDYLAELARNQIAARPVAYLECGVTLEHTLPVALMPGFARGQVSVQDAAAQLAATLVDAHAGDRVLDACAAPGGKAAHILERAPAVSLTAVDIEARRLGRLHGNLNRLGLEARVVTGDASEPAGWWDGVAFDRILLDAPCSGTGVIRRHPDIKLHRTEDDIARLRRLQARLLDGLWPLLRPGGKLLYVTCSIFPDENGDQIGAFLERTGDAAVAPLYLPCGQPDKTGWQILPGENDMDGFYFSGLQKRGGGE
ncbi:MAG: 16S rRNA (cytosine(967)-C(5))-methyltransferase RsmB, partial [Acidiferrobacterales bacterium]